MTLQERIELRRAKLETLSSDLGILKCALEDENAGEAAHEVEQAQDCVDGAISCLRAAFQYAEESE